MQASNLISVQMAEAVEDHDDYDEEDDEDEEEDDMYNDYYAHQELSEDPAFAENQEPDPEAYAYTCVDVEGARVMLNEEVGAASEDLKVIFYILTLYKKKGGGG